MIDLFIGLVCLAIVFIAMWIMVNRKETPAEIVEEIEKAVEVKAPVPEVKEENVVVVTKIKKPRKPRTPKKAK